MKEGARHDHDARSRTLVLAKCLVVMAPRTFLGAGTSGEGCAEVWSVGNRSLNVAIGWLASCAKAPSGAASISESAVLARMRSW
jgi:hypothetical protein